MGEEFIISDTTQAFRVGLILTERCNLMCSHCWLSCGPNKATRMELDDALGYIEQAREIPTVKWISFSGGEPFLFRELLKKLVGYASTRGLYTETVTNCFWATSEKAAAAQLAPLRKAGLDVVNISADDFHQQHLPFDRVRNCYWAAKRLGLKIVIMSAVARSSKLRIREVMRLIGDKDICILGDETRWKDPASALAIETGFVPAGRGKTLPAGERFAAKGVLEGSCKVVLRDVAILPSGQVLPCCSVAGLTGRTEIGNVRRTMLREILMGASQHALFRLLATEGPTGLQRLLGLRHQNGYVDKCHLCYEILAGSRFQVN